MPPMLPSLHEIVPIGILGELDVSVTVAVNVTCDPEFTVSKFGEMFAVVACI